MDENSQNRKMMGVDDFMIELDNQDNEKYVSKELKNKSPKSIKKFFKKGQKIRGLFRLSDLQNQKKKYKSNNDNKEIIVIEENMNDLISENGKYQKNHQIYQSQNKILQNQNQQNNKEQQNNKLKRKQKKYQPYINNQKSEQNDEDENNLDEFIQKYLNLPINQLDDDEKRIRYKYKNKIPTLIKDQQIQTDEIFDIKKLEAYHLLKLTQNFILSMHSVNEKIIQIYNS